MVMIFLSSSFFNNLMSPGLLIGVFAVLLFAVLLFVLFKKKQGYVCGHCGKIHKKKPLRCKSCGFGRLKKQ